MLKIDCLWYNFFGDVMTYKVGDIVTCNISGIEKYGAFVHLDNDYSGLIHISEISYNYVENISDYVEVGDKVKVRVVSVDEANHHVNLSLKDANNAYIHEVGSGFGILKDNLDRLIDMNKNEKD